jgi:hypothetical protein
MKDINDLKAALLHESLGDLPHQRDLASFIAKFGMEVTVAEHTEYLMSRDYYEAHPGEFEKDALECAEEAATRHGPVPWDLGLSSWNADFAAAHDADRTAILEICALEISRRPIRAVVWADPRSGKPVHEMSAATYRVIRNIDAARLRRLARRPRPSARSRPARAHARRGGRGSRRRGTRTASRGDPPSPERPRPRSSGVRPAYAGSAA